MNHGLKRKFGWLMVGILLLFGIFNVVNFYAANQNSEKLDSLKSVYIYRMILSESFELEIKQAVISVELALSTGDAEFLKLGEEELSKLKADHLLMAEHDPEAAVIFGDKEFGQLKEFGELSESILEQMSSGDYSGGLKDVEKLRILRDDLEASLKELRSKHEKDYNLALLDIKEFNSKTIISVLFGSASILLLLIAVLSLLIGQLVTKIVKLKGHFKETNLDKLKPFPLDPSRSHDELDELIRISNRMLTDIKVAKEQLVDMEFLDNVLESMQEALVITNEDGFIQKYNGVALALLDRDTLLDDNLYDVLRTVDGNVFLDALTAEYELSMTVEASVMKDGQHVPVLVSSALLFQKQTREKLRVFTISDISSLKQASREKEQLQVQLAHASKLASIGTLGAGVAHELNNPLAGILGFVGIIKRMNDQNPKVITYCERIERAGGRMKGIINHLREFSREPKDEDIEVIDPFLPFENALILLKSNLSMAGISIELRDYSAGPKSILASSHELESVFQNFITNSRDALEEFDVDEKKIEVTLTTSEKWVEIRYEDNGPGIDENSKEKIFDPFYTTKEVGKGTGLGMFIAHNVTSKYGGHLELVDAHLGGFGIVVKFPLAVEEEASKDVDAGAEIVQIGTWDQSVKGLVVDDEPDILEILEFYFEGTARDVEFIVDSRKVQSKLQSCDYDFILMDLKMPGVDGEDIIKFATKLQPNAKLFVMTGHGYTSDEIERLKGLGVEEVFIKPFNHPELVIEAIKKNLDDPKKVAS